MPWKREHKIARAKIYGWANLVVDDLFVQLFYHKLIGIIS